MVSRVTENFKGIDVESWTLRREQFSCLLGKCPSSQTLRMHLYLKSRERAHQTQLEGTEDGGLAVKSKSAL